MKRSGARSRPKGSSGRRWSEEPFLLAALIVMGCLTGAAILLATVLTLLGE